MGTVCACTSRRRSSCSSTGVSPIPATRRSAFSSDRSISRGFSCTSNVAENRIGSPGFCVSRSSFGGLTARTSCFSTAWNSVSCISSPVTSARTWSPMYPLTRLSGALPGRNPRRRTCPRCRRSSRSNALSTSEDGISISRRTVLVSISLRVNGICDPCAALYPALRRRVNAMSTQSQSRPRRPSRPRTRRTAAVAARRSRT